MDKKKLLLVEDDEFLIKMYEKKFLMEGFDVVIAVDGKEAMDKLVDVRPDMILLDIMMPRLNGIDVLTRIKADENLKNIPVLVLSNMSAGDKVEEAMKLGAVGYFIKSDKTPNEVMAKVKEILGMATTSNQPS